MQLHQLSPKTKTKGKKRIGRGGKRGKTSGRGGKGQTARAGGRPRPELRDVIKRLPKRRGYGKNRARTVNAERIRPYVVNLDALETNFKIGDEVTPKTLIAQGVVRAKAGVVRPFKILGTGALSKALTIKGCLVSASARVKIEEKGGAVVA